MEMTISWVELLYQYGPYALLVLFVFWVAPRQTKLFLDLKPADKHSRLLCGSFAAASWAVVFIMTGFIYSNWKTTEVYTGTLGTYNINNTDIEFYAPLSDNLYISSDFVDKNRILFKFAVVLDSLKTDPQGYVQVTVKTGEQEIGEDLDIAVADLKSGMVHLSVDPENLGQLLVDDDNKPGTPAVPYVPSDMAFSAQQPGEKWFLMENWMTAQAADSIPANINATQIIDELNSSNKYLRANARKKLRSLNITVLQDMLKQTSANSLADQQIKKQISKNTR